MNLFTHLFETKPLFEDTRLSMVDSMWLGYLLEDDKAHAPQPSAPPASVSNMGPKPALAIPDDSVAAEIPFLEMERAKLFGNRHLPEGTLVGVRLNLNLLKRSQGKYAMQTVHHRNYNGHVLGYDFAVTVRNAYLNVNQQARADIASGQHTKFPMASVDGAIVHKQHSLEGTEVRFNPKTGHLFCDTQGRAVKGADEITVFGFRAYCRGKIQYWSENEAPMPIDGVPSEVKFHNGQPDEPLPDPNAAKVQKPQVPVTSTEKPQDGQKPAPKGGAPAPAKKEAPKGGKAPEKKPPVKGGKPPEKKGAPKAAEKGKAPAKKEAPKAAAKPAAKAPDKKAPAKLAAKPFAKKEDPKKKFDPKKKDEKKK